MDCKRVSELFEDYREKILDNETESLIREHLEQCENCRKAITRLDAVDRRLGAALRGLKPSDGFAARVGARIREMDEAGLQPASIPWLRPALLAACVLIVAAGAWIAMELAERASGPGDSDGLVEVERPDTLPERETAYSRTSPESASSYQSEPVEKVVEVRQEVPERRAVTVSEGTVEQLGRSIAVAKLKSEIDARVRQVAGTDDLTGTEEAGKDLDLNRSGLELRLAKNRGEVYRKIGRSVKLIERYLNSGKTDDQYAGLLLAMITSELTVRKAHDFGLASKIYDSFVIANLHMAHPDARHAASAHNILAFANRVYGSSGDRIWLYENMVEKAPNVNSRDFARFRLFKTCDQRGDYDRALHWLQQISDGGGFSGVKSRITEYAVMARIKSTQRKER
ncbi:anti-sigma factor family protein [Verrucomicrobiota bacterium]